MLFKRNTLLGLIGLAAACGGRQSVDLDRNSNLASFTVGRFTPKSGAASWQNLKLTMTRKDKPTPVVPKNISADAYGSGNYSEVSTKVEAGEYRILLEYFDKNNQLMYQSCKTNPNEVDKPHFLEGGKTYLVKIMICDARTGQSTGEVESKDLASVEITPEAVDGSSGGAGNAQQIDGANPLKNLNFYVDPNSLAVEDLRLLQASNSPDARYVEFIAKQPSALWLSERFDPDMLGTLRRNMNNARSQGTVPVFVLYDVPNRDCDQQSSGGQAAAPDYRRFVDNVVNIVGDSRAVFIIEPDALPMIDKCLNAAQQQDRKDLLRYAVTRLKSKSGIAVYLDAGHSAWRPAEVMVPLLQASGIEKADGFALNTSNYQSTGDNLAFGRKLSALLGGKHFVIDTSRNGNGPKGDLWCNPRGRALGKVPSWNTMEQGVDAFLWTKRPGESDGQCEDSNDGSFRDPSKPAAGKWWRMLAIEQARNAGI